MQANNKNSLQIMILILATTYLSLSLLCITRCQADDDTNIINVCNSHLRDDTVRDVCNNTLRSPENNNTCGPDYDLVCMGKFVNAKAMTATLLLKNMSANAINAAAPTPGTKDKKRQKSGAKTCKISWKSAYGQLNECNKIYEKNKTMTASIKSILQTKASAAMTNLNTCGDESTNFTAASKAALNLIGVELAAINLFYVPPKKNPNSIA